MAALTPNFVTVLRSNRESELLVLKSRLENAGIPCFLKNQYVTQVLNYMPSFEIELQVHRSDLDVALQIITGNPVKS